jgi:hypothetical protein
MGAAILIGLFGMLPAGEGTDQSDVVSAVVRVDNLATVPNDYIELAEGRAAEVFKRIGARVTWIDEETAFREHRQVPFTVVLIKSDGKPFPRSIVMEALAFADPSVSRAHVFYDRVEALTGRSQRSAASMLGDVIAHELGHLMLRGRKHSPRGIMRSGIELHLIPTDTFTAAEARQILNRLSEERLSELR